MTATEERLAERATPAGLASTLSWTATGVLLYLGKLDAGEREALPRLAEWVSRLKEAAAQIEHVVSLYEEGRADGR